MGVAGAAAVWPLQVIKDYNFFFGDEMIVVTVAQAMARGAVLYRDVWEFLQPGSFAALAAVFRVLGSGPVVLDACALALFGALVGLMHRLVARSASRAAAWLAVVAFVLLLRPLGVWLSPHWMGTAAALLVALALTREAPPGKPAALALGGACVTLTFLFQQHKGAFVAAAVGGAYLVSCAVGRAGARPTLRGVGWLLGGALAAAAPLAVWLTAHGLWAEWWDATVVWVLRGYAPANREGISLLPLRPGLSAGQLLAGLWTGADLTAARLLPLAYVLAPVALLPRESRVPRHVLWLAWAIGLGVFGTALTRYDQLRLQYTAPATLVVAGLACARVGDALRGRWSARVRIVRIASGGAAAALCLAAGQQYVAHVQQLWREGQRITVSAPGGRVTLWSGGFGDLRDVAEVLAVLRREPADARLFVYPTGWGYGYLSGLANGTPYHFVLPGYTRADQWERLMNVLRRGGVDVVVWDRTYDPRWMRDVYPTLPPESVWQAPPLALVQGAGWDRMLETRTAVVYRRRPLDAARHVGTD